MIGHIILALRRLTQKEHATRWPERLAVPSVPRPDGKIIWIHAASVGEVQTALTLIPFLDTLRQTSPFTLLITTGTVTSAAFVASRLPDWAIHQFYPLDTPVLTRRFLSYWHPSAALWMESEIWPFMLRGLHKRNVPVLLINARLSPRSARRWGYFPRLARAIMRPFTFILAQNESAAAAFRRFVDCPVVPTGNLKYSAPPLPVNETASAILRQAIQGRPVILYASTHAGEEAIATDMHQSLRTLRPNLLTIIAPRHPARADAIVNAMSQGVVTARRTDAHAPPLSNTDIYLADTIGELGLFYQLADIAYIGRSFSDDGGGGHNPLEAAHFGCAILSGPHTQNLADIYTDMAAAQAVTQLQDIGALHACMAALMQDQALLQQAQQRAKVYITGQMAIAGTVTNALRPHLERALSV